MATGIRVRAPCTGRATDEKQKQEKKWQDSYWVGPRTPEREGRGRWRRRTKQGGRRAAGRRGGPSTGQGHPGGAAAAPLPFPGPSPTHYFASERPDCPQDARGPQCAGEADVLLGGRVSFHLGEVPSARGHACEVTFGRFRGGRSPRAGSGCRVRASSREAPTRRSSSRDDAEDESVDEAEGWVGNRSVGHEPRPMPTADGSRERGAGWSEGPGAQRRAGGAAEPTPGDGNGSRVSAGGLSAWCRRRLWTVSQRGRGTWAAYVTPGHRRR
uniref:Uncharacterized protein n=1 Tax=Rousettus aegyptiacus TaxID=9407 RepID=A0A7J8B866_ROUAE|nr:hypothetical protein HJG63_010026 [Rousettus aegyptiacus]